MADNKSFSVSRKGYNCTEVDEYIAFCERNDAELRDSYASLQEKYDSLFEENGTLIKEREQLRQECVALAGALQQLRENADKKAEETVEEDAAENADSTPDTDYKAKYEEAVAELEELKAKQSMTAEAQSSASATQMIEEVAEVVKRVESDARRKAEAVTAAAKLEQTQAQLIRSRVNDEVKSLIQMLEGFLEDRVETEE